ncbi:MAG: M43 family zinc metalloprotease [Bacteroidota bacterium]
MKKKLLPLIFIGVWAYAITNLAAQNVHSISDEPLKYCGTDEAMHNLFLKNPGLKEEVKRIELEDQKNAQKNSNQEIQFNPPVYIIPVVVHVIHNYGTENISDAQVKDAINILTRDFRKQNADADQVVAGFKPIIADCEIEFKLAQLDPNGACTNGIDRIVSNLTYNADDNSKLNQWPRNKYLNIWTVASLENNVAGYSTYPSAVNSFPGKDGIVILHNYIGSIGTGNVPHSRALTHEVGHWINLYHPWGNTNNPEVSCGDDGVSDTPETKGWKSCNLTKNDICNPGKNENVENYMEYSYCSKMFTLLQKTRMRNALNSSISSRNNLCTASNLAATGVSTAPQLCKADFSAATKIACVSVPITFTDLSWSATPTSWQWNFDNNSTIDATTKNPTYTYSTSGTYSVTLTVSDGINTRTTTKASYITVLGNIATAQAIYSEGFENAGFPYSDWYTLSSYNTGVTWNRVTTAAATGTSSLKLNNYAATTIDVDETISQSIDLSNMATVSMTFQVAYAMRNSSDVDQLRVLISADCGNSWIQRYSKPGTSLATAGIVSGAFTPSASQWRKETVNIAPGIGAKNFRYRFEFTGNGIGNNIYIDDINITGTPIGIAEEIVSEFNLSVNPNPFNGNAIIFFSTAQKHKIELSVYDLIGKEIIPITNKEMNAGSYELPLNAQQLKSGIYFVKLTVDNYSVVKKIIVQ